MGPMGLMGYSWEWESLSWFHGNGNEFGNGLIGMGGNEKPTFSHFPPTRSSSSETVNLFLFLPRCMECRRGLAMRFCPSVCMSDSRVNCDKTVERCVQISTLYDRSFSLVY